MKTLGWIEKSSTKKDAAVMLFTIAIIFLCFFVFIKMNWMNSYQIICGPLTILLVLLYGISWLLFLLKKIDEKQFMYMLIFTAILFRIGFALYKPSYYYDHDTGDYNYEDGGHAGYIISILKMKRLPQDNFLQYYQPPFFYMLAAGAIGFFQLLLPGKTFEELFEAAKLISTAASVITVFLSVKIADAMDMKYIGKCAVVMVQGFLPVFILMCGWVNNDALSLMFIYLIVLYTAYWYKDSSIKNTVLLAIWYGLGLMTKASCAFPALFTGALMIYKFFSSSNKKAMCLKLGIFSIIAFPLGLWFHIRNYILFSQPLGGILSQEGTFDNLIEKYGYWNVFIRVPWKSLLTQIYCVEDLDYSVFLTVMRTASFGDYTYLEPHLPVWGNAVARGLLYTNAALVIVSLGVCIYLVWKKQWLKAFVPGVFYGIQILFFVWFILKNPFSCSINARYIGICFLINAIYLGYFLDLSQIFTGNKKILMKWKLPTGVILVLLCVMNVLSILLICNMLAVGLVYR